MKAWLKRIFSTKPKSRPRIFSRLEVLEARVVPVSAIWEPLGGAVPTTWAGEDSAGNTNWVQVGGPLGMRITDNKANFGWPGEYGSGGSTSDIATFNSLSNLPCTNTNGLSKSVEAFNILSAYSGNITVTTPLVINGGGGPGHFDMANGTITLNSGNGSGYALEILDCTATSFWSNGTITQTAGTDGMMVSCDGSAVHNTFNVLDIQDGDPTLNANLIVSGDILGGGSPVTAGLQFLNTMTGNLQLGAANTITIQGNATFYDLVTNSQDTVGGIVTPGLNPNTYSLIIQGRTAGDVTEVASVDIGASSGMGTGSVLFNRPIELVNAQSDLTVYQSATLHDVGMEPTTNDSITQLGGATLLSTIQNTPNTGSMVLSGNLTVKGGSLTLYVNDLTEDLNVLTCPQVTIYTGAKMVVGPDNGVNSTYGTVRMEGNLTFQSGAYYYCYGWGITNGGSIDILDVWGKVDLGPGLNVYVTYMDGNPPNPDHTMNIIVDYGTNDTIVGSVASIANNLNRHLYGWAIKPSPTSALTIWDTGS